MDLKGDENGSAGVLAAPTRKLPTEVLDIDSSTPDSHVPRDPDMIRLTGVYPFNAEAPLSSLYDQGFLTPNSLFYVRNHGAVPQIEASRAPSWEVSIEGLVENPTTFTLSQLLSKFDQITQPVTLVCAGNRRKEQNMVRQTKGFGWGAAGVSTALFTGPLLSEVMEFVKPLETAGYLWMEGADELPNGNYGTSIKISQVLDPSRGIMLAHTMNGDPLPRDHGFPLRVVVPGQIGGRSVKWLKRIVIADRPSDNWYHIFDNRVLPTIITPEMANDEEAEEMWKDERYAVYDLNANSAVVYPKHGEQVSFMGEGAAGGTYFVRGYAYTGGTRRVSRVEVSLDRGVTWELAEITYPEDNYQSTRSKVGEKCHCWCFWNLNISVDLLAESNDLIVRAMDDSMMVQPRDMYWSVLGLMNNSWFRVAIVKDTGNGVLTFEHPTQAGTFEGGWMERGVKDGRNLLDGNWGEGVVVPNSTTAKIDVRRTNKDVQRSVDIDELKLHDGNDAKAPWFIVNDEVYDGGPFLGRHPGGRYSIMAAAGKNVTEEFMGSHSDKAKRMMAKYHIGTLTSTAREILSNSTPSGSSTLDNPYFLSSNGWKDSKLIAKREASWNTRIYTFSLEHPSQLLGLPMGQHLLLRVYDAITDQLLTRPYTPISPYMTPGTVDILVKIYFTTPECMGGKMSQALDSLELGDTVSFKRPLHCSQLTYLSAPGMISVSNCPDPISVSVMVMICAGTGITAVFGILQTVLSLRLNLEPMKCVLLYGNREQEDILLYDELERLVEMEGENGRLKIVYTLTQPCIEWEGGEGRIRKELIEKIVGCVEKNGDEIQDNGRRLVLVCGPDGMIKETRDVLGEIGVGQEDVVCL